MTCGACKAVEIYPYESLLFTCHCDLLLFLYFTPFLTYVFHVICIRGYPYAIPYHRYSPDELLSVVTTTFYQLRLTSSCPDNRLWAPVSYTSDHTGHLAEELETTQTYQLD